MLLPILRFLVCLLTIATGAYALIAPRKTVGFTGLSPQGGRGITEIRAVLGGLFIALGVAPLLLGDAAFRMLGVAYLAVAVTRFVSIVYDKSGTRSNWISLAVEIVFGMVLIF